MKKNLRYLFAAVLMMFGMTAMAEDVIWSEDWTGTKADDVPSAINANYSEENGNGTTKIYEADLAGGVSPELLIGKGNKDKGYGSFTAKVDLKGKSGEMTLSYKANYDRITVTISEIGVTLGEKAISGTSYSIPVTVPAGTESITITFANNSSSNVRFDDAKLYQGTAKKPAGLSWGKASTTLTIGEEVTLTLSNENNLPVTYDSSDKEVATIDAQGVITLKAAGKTTLSAAFAGNDEYEAQTVSIEVTVKENGSGDDPQPTTIITVAKALEILASYEDGQTSTEEYDVKGYVVGAPDWQRKNDGTLYGNVEFKIADQANGTSLLTAYHCNNLNNAKYTEDTKNNFKEGDIVTIHGNLKNYRGTPEIVSCYLMSIEATSTAISTVQTAVNEGVVYNLQGQQVMQPVKGLYIINGKKVVIK